MAWQTVAEGTNISELEALVADMELPKGTKIRVTMETPVPWAFDLAGAELVFNPFVPDGLDLIDVYGEGGKGVVDMEADPAWLVATLGFIRTHWVAIAIAGFLLPLIVSFIRVMVSVATAKSPLPAIAIIAGATVLGFILLRESRGRGP